MRIPAKKWLKPDMASPIFTKSIYGGSSGPSAPPAQRQTSKRRHKLASKLMQDNSSTHSYNKSTVMPIDSVLSVSIPPESSDMYLRPQEYHYLQEMALVRLIRQWLSCIYALVIAKLKRVNYLCCSCLKNKKN